MSHHWYWIGPVIAFMCGVAARPYIDRMMDAARRLPKGTQNSSDPVEHAVDEYDYQR